MPAPPIPIPSAEVRSGASCLVQTSHLFIDRSLTAPNNARALRYPKPNSKTLARSSTIRCSSGFAHRYDLHGRRCAARAGVIQLCVSRSGSLVGFLFRVPTVVLWVGTPALLAFTDERFLPLNVLKSWSTRYSALSWRDFHWPPRRNVMGLMNSSLHAQSRTPALRRGAW